MSCFDKASLLQNKGLNMNQPLLFENMEEISLSVNDVASQLKVSTASVRNWLKTGYLKQINPHRISRSSFEYFKNNVAGFEKLRSRANKSLKDRHDHEKLQRKFQNLLKEKNLELQDIGTQYEISLSDSYRNKEGVYYTPVEITERFFRYLPENATGLSFCDPCCGSGNFIMTAIAKGFKPENIYGYDTDPFAVTVTKERIFKHTGYKTNQIIYQDFLKSTLEHDSPYFDVILTNPPWGKKINKEQKKIYAQIFCAGKSLDTSSLFFFAALSRLRADGILGFLLQDAFFNVASFEDVRKQALSLRLKALLDFGKPFKGLLTKAKGIILQQKKAPIGNHVECEANKETAPRLQDSFSRNPKSILNFLCTSEASEVIEYLYQQEHVTLSGQASFGLGIVTGNNKKFCIGVQKEGYLPVLKGTDLHKDGIDAPSNFIPGDLSLYQQVAPKSLFLSKEKLIYRFISSDLVFYHDCQQRFFLNSVNMLVLGNDFPIRAKQLAQLLNSRVINWLFKSIFETHKILRSDIESLPIYTRYFDHHSAFKEASFLNYLGVEEDHNGAFRIKK